MRWSLPSERDLQAPSSVLARPLGYLSLDLHLHRAVIVLLQRQGHAL
jgi:hypothetical protein